jgi:hypothetical protein
LLQTQKTAALETQEMLKTASGDNAMRRTQTFPWFSQFRCGETLIEYCEHLGCPFTGHTDENMEKVHKIIDED